MEYAGILHAYRQIGSKQSDSIEYLSNYFVCREFEGELKASDEGELLWVEAEESLTLPGIHPFYVKLLPDILKGNFPIEISIEMST